MKNRKLNRLPDFDYSQEAIYFITSCTKNRMEYFGNIVDGAMELNDFGKIAHQQIGWLAEQYSYVELHNFVVMPNHVHILLEIKQKQDSLKVKSISSLIGAYKTTSSKQIHHFGNIDFEWQRSFHDHIVRNQQSYEQIHQYITENPIRWEQDRFNPVFLENVENDKM